MIFSSPHFFQKTNKQIRHLLLVDLFSFIFWKKVKTPKRHFEIYWTSGTAELKNWLFWGTSARKLSGILLRENKSYCGVLPLLADSKKKSLTLSGLLLVCVLFTVTQPKCERQGTHFKKFLRIGISTLLFEGFNLCNLPDLMLLTAVLGRHSFLLAATGSIEAKLALLWSMVSELSSIIMRGNFFIRDTSKKSIYERDNFSREVIL